MSGDLENPSRSIPRGTMTAVGAGFIIYAALPFLLNFRAPADELIKNPLIMFSLARWPWLILAGIWGATLSSAIGSILGAPRVLQALARDGVLPRGLRWLGKGSGASDEPRAGTFLTFALAVFLAATVELNMIAPVLTMFFLTTYLVLNLSAGVESFLSSPSFRPAFRVHWGVSILGALGCFAVMFLINAVAAAVAAFLVALLYIWLKKRRLAASWGDVRRGLWMMLVREGLLRLDRSPDPRNWRPNILILSGSPTRRWHLIEFTDMLTHGRGMFTVAVVLPYDSRDAQQKAGLEKTIKEYLDKRGIPALVRLISATDPFSGAENLAEIYGLGPVIPNTMLLGTADSDDEEHRKRYFRLIENVYEGGKNIIILNHSQEEPLIPDPESSARRRIDVWWSGFEGNGGLMLILADALRLDRNWHDAELRINMAVETEEAAVEVKKNMENLLSLHNISAEYDIIETGGRSFTEIFRQTSENASIIFHGLPSPGEGFPESYREIYRRIEGMPSTALILSGKNTSFSEIIKKE